MSVIDLLDNGLKRAPERLCLADKSSTYTHAQVHAMSHQAADALQAAGVKTGSRVAIYSPNVALAMVALVGTLRAGAVWLPVQMRNTLRENIEFLAENGCEFVFFHSSVQADVDEMSRAIPGLKGAVCLDSVGAYPFFLDWIADRTTGFPDVDPGPEGLAWIKATGGTTGKPKSVMICQRNVEALFASFHLCMPLPEPHVNLVVAPITHGAGNIALCILFGGGSVILHERSDPAAIVDAIEKHRVTTLFLPPTVIYNLLAAPATRGRDYSSLRYLIYAGAPMSAAKLAEAIDIFGPVVAQAWGQTEAPFICTYMGPREYVVEDPELLHKRLRSCGRPSPLMRVEVMDDAGRMLPPNEIGELVVRGNLVMRGYFNRPEENEAVSRFGWHHTGDVGYRDEDGYFYIVDRKKDMIISGGFNIYPSEIEQVLWQHPAILDCAVIGVPDEKWGEAVKAVVELKQGHQVSETELKDHCRVALGGLKTPKSIEVWDSLPRSTVGKVLKREVRERFWAGQERRV